MIPGKSNERYTIYVDISAKIEAWHKNSVIAVANGYSTALLIAAKDKPKAAELVRHYIPHEPVQFVLMAAFIYISVQTDIAKISRIIIDRDYSGIEAERIVRRRLAKLIQQTNPKFKAGAIRVANVAESRADVLAREAYRGNIPIDGVITLAQIERVLQM